MSLIDTRGPAEFFLRGRGLAQQEQAQQQQVRENAARMAQQASQFDQRHTLDLQQFELQRQEQLRRQAEDEAVASIMREQYSRLIPSAPMAPGGVGPTQPDGWSDIRGSLATAPLPVLKAWGQIIPNRAKLDSMRKMLPVLVEQRSMIAPDSPERVVLDHMIDMVNVNDVDGFEKAARARVQAQTKAAEENAKIRTLAQDMSTQFGIPLEEAVRRVRLTKGNVINEGQNQTGAVQNKAIASLAKDINAPVDGLSLVSQEPRVDENGEEWVTVEKGGNKYEIKAAMWPLIQKFGSWENAIAALRQASGKPAMMAPSPPPPTQTAAPVAQPAAQGPPIDVQVQVIQQLTKQLGREPTDDEIDAAMEGV